MHMHISMYTCIRRITPFRWLIQLCWFFEAYDFYFACHQDLIPNSAWNVLATGSSFNSKGCWRWVKRSHGWKKMNAFFECLNSVGNMKNLGIGSNTLPKTNSSPLKIGNLPKGKDRLPTIHFQVLLLLVSGRVEWFGQLRRGGGPHFLQIHKLLHDLCHYHSGMGNTNNMKTSIDLFCCFKVSLCGFCWCLCWGLNVPILRHKMSRDQVLFWDFGSARFFFLRRRIEKPWLEGIRKCSLP